MRHIRLDSIYIGNLNYKIKIPFFFAVGERYLPVFCIESVIFLQNTMQCHFLC